MLGKEILEDGQGKMNLFKRVEKNLGQLREKQEAVTTGMGNLDKVASLVTIIFPL